MGGLGTLVRRRRLELDLTLDELAERIGKVKSYVWGIENERRVPPDAVLRELASALSMDEGVLVRAARWDETPAMVKREMESLRTTQESRRKLAARLIEIVRGSAVGSDGRVRGALDETYRSGELSRLVDRISPSPESAAGGEVGAAAASELAPASLALEVPLINSVAAGYPREFTDLGYPARVADQYVRCPDVRDADAFAARVVGDSMEPAYQQGDIVVFSPLKAVKNGSDCFARLEPDHETTLKRVYFETDAEGNELVRLQPLNSAYPPRVVRREQVAALYAAVSVIKRVE
ncbi:MAG: S24 family peptidase [Phycisphaerales bacterium]|nr:S24 family peptidase [Phycisphaerales bacterium]